MFDIGWSELLVLGIVALIVIGPKDLPIVLRTVGRYAGIVKRQAAEFRAQFEEAIREAEIDGLKKDVEGFGRDIEGTVRDASRDVEKEFDDARRAIDAPREPDPDAHDENGIPVGGYANVTDESRASLPGAVDVPVAAEPQPATADLAGPGAGPGKTG